MAGSASHRSDKEQVILDCALNLLKETGDAGLTMRKIADCAGMRLSNVQYYFKSRDDVLKAMVTRHVEECTADLKRLTREDPAPTPRARAHHLIRAGLSHGMELSDMCRIFRELWAISSRNTIVRDHMTGYYLNFSALMADFVIGEDVDPAVHDRVRSLLLPFFEGYSVTAAALPLPMEQVADMLTDLVMSILAPR